MREFFEVLNDYPKTAWALGIGILLIFSVFAAEMGHRHKSK